MTPTPVTPELLHRLVAGSHAEGTTRLAVVAVVEYDDRVLLITYLGGAVDDPLDLPAGLVLPGETLTDTLARILAVLGLDIDEVTGYLGHHDHNTAGEVTRVFHFVIAVSDPHVIPRAAHIGHCWVERDQHLDLPRASTTPRPVALATWRTRHRLKESPLAGPLRASARGLHPAEAGTELLIHHAIWLQRSDFRDRFVRTGASMADNTQMATIDWPAAITALETGDLPCSGGEGRMLRLAASLIDGIPVDLHDALTGLDDTNLNLVAASVLHAGGR
jgi:ADP-ribose pyrophosphatase YjhB (NUDIX family)